MILVITLESGTQLRYPVKHFQVTSTGIDVEHYATTGFFLDHVNLSKVAAIHTEHGRGRTRIEPDSDGSGISGSGERADLRGVEAGEMPLSRGPARIGFGKSDAQRLQVSCV